MPGSAEKIQRDMGDQTERRMSESYKSVDDRIHEEKVRFPPTAPINVNL
jgi:hypothetical protein